MSDNINNINAPSNWAVLTNDGTNLTAVNNKSGESFSGTTSDFNTLVSAAVVRTAPASYVTLPLLDGGVDYGDYPGNPAPGFAHVFATPNGVRMLDEYGDILGNHESGGGGGIVEPVETIEFSTVSVGESMPLPATGRYRLGMVGANPAIIYASGLVIKVEDGSIIYDPSAGGGAE